VIAALHQKCSWPVAEAGLALEALARESRLATHAAELLPPPPLPPGAAWRGVFDSWIQRAAAQLGVEAEPVEPLYDEPETLIRSGAPALLAARHEGETRFFVLLGPARIGRGCSAPIIASRWSRCPSCARRCATRRTCGWRRRSTRSSR